jgi:hypothetical protein
MVITAIALDAVEDPLAHGGIRHKDAALRTQTQA